MIRAALPRIRAYLRRAQQLGRYHLLDRIAFGGMAEIYRAKTFDGNGQAHLVAVKRVLAHLAEDDDFIQMLVDEARSRGCSATRASRASTSSHARTASTSSRWSMSTAKTCAPCSSVPARRRNRSLPST